MKTFEKEFQNGDIPVKYYKVLTVGNESPTSNLVLEYKPGEWVEAPIGGLFVFDSLPAAQRYGTSVNLAREYTSGGASGVVLWECECEEPIPLPEQLTPNPLSLSASLCNAFWSGTPWTGICVIPNGTLTFKRVKLTRLINTVEELTLLINIEEEWD
jgi:hypothetical protein